MFGEERSRENRNALFHLSCCSKPNRYIYFFPPLWSGWVSIWFWNASTDVSEKPEPTLSEEFSSGESGKSGFFLWFSVFFEDISEIQFSRSQGVSFWTWLLSAREKCCSSGAKPNWILLCCLLHAGDHKYPEVIVAAQVTLQRKVEKSSLEGR